VGQSAASDAAPARPQGQEPAAERFAGADEDVRVALGRLLRRLGKLGLWRTGAPDSPGGRPGVRRPASARYPMLGA